MLGVGRDLCGSPSPNPLLKHGHVHQATQDLVQAGLEYLQRRRYFTTSRQKDNQDRTLWGCKYKCHCGFYLNYEVVCSNKSQTYHKGKLRTLVLVCDFKSCGQDSGTAVCRSKDWGPERQDRHTSCSLAGPLGKSWVSNKSYWHCTDRIAPAERSIDIFRQIANRQLFAASIAKAKLWWAESLGHASVPARQSRSRLGRQNAEAHC